MYLKSLELFGFKSFAHRTVLNFHRGVTAVVGPNGCGKSNVLDAIRWVLGEQSAKALRGGEMADVIFSGTDSKQAVGMCEVTLTFAECEKELGVDYHEVAITRRIFRDGRSEYCINKSACRLRDIHQLFMDTGIGRSAYSIMEQGKIDQILSSRPEERRAVFEEAAGITRYKAQKKEALRKLDYTEANLLRLTDIIKEVKRQIGSLQRQAAKARRYQGLMQDLKILDTHLSHHRYSGLITEMGSTSTEAARLQQQQRELESIAARHEAELQTARHDLTTVEETLGLQRSEAETIRTRAASARHKIDFSTERATEAAQLIEKHRADLATADERLQIHENQLADADQQIEASIASLRIEETHLREQQQRTGDIKDHRQKAENELRQLQHRIQTAESTIATLRSELATAIHQREAGETRQRLLAEDLQQIETKHSNTAEQVAAVQQQIETANSRLQTARESLGQSEADHTTRRTALATIDASLSETRSQLSSIEARLRVLRELNEEGAGLSEGAQALLKGEGLPEGVTSAILGALASQIEVHPDHITAIEALLGQHLHAVIVRDTTVAEHFLEALRQGRGSRAMFAATDWLPVPGEIQLETLPEGAIARAADLVECTTAVAPLVHRLLDRALVVPDAATAQRIRADHGPLPVATLTGECFDPHGLVTAGPVLEGANSILRRKVEIRELETTETSIRNQLAALTEDRNRAAEQLDLAADVVAEAREALQHAQVALSTLQGQLRLLQREAEETGAKLNTARWELQNITRQTEAAQTRIQGLEENLQQQSASLATQTSQRTERQQQLEQLIHQEQQLVDALNELRIKVTTERQHHDNLQRQRQPMAIRLRELRETIEARRNDITQYTNRITTLETEKTALTARLAEDEAALATVTESITAATARKAELAAGVAEVENSLRSLRRELQQCQEAHGKLEVKSTQLQLRADRILEHVTHRYHTDLTQFQADSYGLLSTLRDLRTRRRQKSAGPTSDAEASTTEAASPAAAPECSTADANAPVVDLDTLDATPAVTEQASFDWDEVDAFVRELDERLDGIGPVNLDAIQEFDELEERHKFLEEQNADLLKSKEELLEVINKINKTTRELFADTFVKVRENFAEMFTELFGGGKANLLLTDESDPLESGIDIIAKPPGKQLQSITLLSGGEKTMTAVALLFAIYMVKPSPFCVLDEMDAPLDESNISRFIKLLDRFVTQSQFVVITHNKRTIARAEVLYGVTMEEHGISKLVGVRLAKQSEASDPARALDNPEATPGISESFGKSGNLKSETIPPPDPQPTPEPVPA